MLPSRGRPGSILLMEIDRELGAPDIMRLATDTTIPRLAAPTVQRLRDRHHAIAIHLASGKTAGETARLVGLTAQRVRDLEANDPAFQDLLASYRDEVESRNLDEAQEFHGKLIDVGRQSLEEIQERLADDAARKKLSIEELRRLSEMALDRTTNPPKTATPAVTVPTKITFNMGNRTLVPKTIDQSGQIVDTKDEDYD